MLEDTTGALLTGLAIGGFGTLILLFAIAALSPLSNSKKEEEDDQW